MQLTRSFLIPFVAAACAHRAATQTLLVEIPTDGSRPAGGFDVDGDGGDDVLIGPTLYSGESGAPLMTFDPCSSGYLNHWSLVGDFDGDGVVDAGFSCLLQSEIRSGADRSLLWQGCPSLCSLFPEIEAAGDVNGDGRTDVLLCDSEFFGAGGELKVVLAPSGATAYYQKNVGACTEVDYSGVRGIGDADGDGLDDFVFHTFNQTGYCELGARAVVQSVTAGTLREFESNGTPYGIRPAGDVDGDGLADVVVRGTFSDAPGQSLVRVVSVQSGAVLHELPALVAGNLIGLGDLDCDGLSDLAYGDASDATGGPGAGAIFVLSGADLSLLSVVFGAPGDQLAGIERAGDTNGDGLTDFFAYGQSSVRIYSGFPPSVASYCTGKTSSAGCVATLDSAGWPTASGADDFHVLARNALAQKPGLFFHGTSGALAIPFLGGTLCVAPPLQRGPALSSTPGTDCSSGYVFPFEQGYAQALGIIGGTTVHGQFWMRDPDQADGTGVALSDGIAFEWCP